MQFTKNTKILIVDNDPRELEIKKVQFNKAGYSVTIVDSARMAKRALMIADFDYIITDIMMPVETGLELKEYINIKYPETTVYTTSCHCDWADLPKPYYPIDFENFGSRMVA